jgi:hypothetical protein
MTALKLSSEEKGSAGSQLVTAERKQVLFQENKTVKGCPKWKNT